LEKLEMKKSLVALAAIAFVGAASAQTAPASSVTLWGVVDLGVSHYTNGAGQSVTKMTSSGLSSDQLGFRGTEDLGGGMSANFWLEGKVTPQDGNAGGLQFGRRSTLSLAGNFGELRLGRDYSPTFWNYTVFDPFGTLGAGSGSNITLANLNPGNGVTGTGDMVRAANGVSYGWGFAPNGQFAVGSGVYFSATYALGGTVSPTTPPAGSSDGNYLGGRLGYANGPVNVAVSLAQEKNQAEGDFTYSNIGGSYNLGPASVSLLYAENKNGSAGGNLKFKTWELGATIQAGPGYIPVSFADGKMNDAIGSHSQQFAVGYVYNLSKRTALYATYSHINNKTGALATFAGGNGSSSGLADANGSGNGYDIGVKTSF